MVARKRTHFRINVTAHPKKLTVRVGGKKVKLTPVTSLEELQKGADVYYYESSPELNRFATG